MLEKMIEIIKAFFSSPTFDDHTDRPSFGRKAIFWIVLNLIVFIYLGLYLITKGGSGALIADYIKSIVGPLVGLAIAFYGSAQYAKAKNNVSEPIPERTNK